MASSSPANLKDNFLVLPCTPEDVPAMVRVYQAAFSTDALNIQRIRNVDPKDDYNHTYNRFLSHFSKPEVRCFKVTEASTGTMAAFSRWAYPHVTEKKQDDAVEKAEERALEIENEVKMLAGKSDWPEGTDLELTEAMFGGFEGYQKKYVDPENFYVAQLVCTDPKYQRKGLATKCLQHVLDIADAEGRKAYIEGSEAGTPVYRKAGFKDVDGFEVDGRKWGIERMVGCKIMIREPKGELKR